MQRNFGPLKLQVDDWRAMQLSTAAAKLRIYQAFIEEETGFPKHLARKVHELYFHPVYEEFQARTMWSLSNAFTSQGAGADSAIQSHSEAGGISAGGPTFVTLNKPVGVRSPESCRQLCHFSDLGIQRDRPTATDRGRQQTKGGVS
jgi:hypothetical protein